MKDFFRKYRVLFIIIAVVISAGIITGSVLLINRKTVSDQRDEIVMKLEATAGTYDENTIVLSNTSKYEAEYLADKLGARLRISKDGKYAALYLPEDKTVIEVYKDDSNLKYISAMSPDYLVRLSEEQDADEEEILVHIPKAPETEIGESYYNNQTYLNYLNLKDLYNGESPRITVAIIDSGIDTDHPEFAGRISDWSYNATADRIVRDYNNDWSLIEDTYGHGTLVAGVIGAALDGKGIMGLLPNSELLIIKAECDDKGNFKVSDLVFGLYYAIERDVPVVNMSFALSGEPGLDPFEDAAILAYDSDIICVSASGNSSTPGIVYPAANTYVIGVGSLEEDSWELADYSNYGDNTDVVAPGTVFTTAMGGGYKYAKGTSFSTPIVTAAAALYKSNIGYYDCNDRFYERLHASCYDLGDKGPDFYYGYGAVDFYALLKEPTGTVTFEMLADELENKEQLFVNNHPIQDIPEPERLYAVFDGWYYDPQFTEELNWYEDCYNTDVTLYAKWANEDDTVPYDYRILNDGTVEILGYKGKRRFITIPDYIEGRQVSSIGMSAFQHETRLRRIILPHYLKNIGDFAFQGCSNIVNMAVPTGVVNIGVCAFADCPRLTSLTLGNSLQTVGEFAFKNCGYLTSIYLPKTVRSIDGSAFAGDVSMMSILTDEKNADFISIDGVLYSKSKSTLVAYPEALAGQYSLMDETVSIGRYAFYGASVFTVDMKSVEYIDEYAFSYSSILYIDIPDSCVLLGDDCFEGCVNSVRLSIGRGLEEIPLSAFKDNTALTELFIPNNIKLIGQEAFTDTGVNTLSFEENSLLYGIEDGAFFGTSIQALALPSSLSYIGGKAFSGCLNLSSVSFGSTPILQTIGGEAFSDDLSLKSIQIPETVRKIGMFCFSGSGLRGEVHIPASLTSYGEGMFAMCYDLASIRIDPDNDMFEDIDGVVYNEGKTTLIEYPAGKKAHIFTPLDTTLSIANCAFYGNNQIDKMILPDSVDYIGSYAFFKCRTVREYELSQNLEYVGSYAFAGNLSLSEIIIPDSLKQFSRFTFEGDLNLRSVYISDESSMKRIGMYALAGCGITEFRIPKKIASVAQYAFSGCDRLTKVVFAENSELSTISAYFFLGCDSIEEIEFGGGSRLISVQAHGFHGLTCLRRIDFGDAKIENIDNYAFRQCPALTEISIPETVKNLGRFAFYRCSSLSSLTVPEKIEHIGEYAFLGTNHFNLYFTSETLPIYLDENWDAGIEGYYTGVLETVEAGDWEYAALKNGTVSILKYNGTAKDIDLTSFEYGAVSVIGGYAFAYTDVESVLLPDTLEQIQRYAFAECTSLRSLTVPENVTFIAQYAFYRTGITSLTFAGDNLKVIEQYAFSATKKLDSVTLPGSLEKLGNGVFYQSGISFVSFGTGYSINTIPENTFAETKLKNVVIPDCVTEIGNNAFSHNLELKNADFGRGEGLIIKSNAFYNTGLTSVSIGDNVGFIGEYAFMDLDSLTAFTVDENNPYYTVEDGILYNKEKTKLISAPAGKTGSFVIPKEVEVLGFGAFENSKMSEITIEEGSKLITLGYRVFYGMKNLTEFTVPQSVVSIDYYAFAECDSLRSVKFEEGNRLSGIYEGAFFGCRSLDDIMLPDTIVEISDYAFYACESLDRLPFSDTSEIMGIYDYAFAYTDIEDIDLPSQLYDIGEFAFRGIPIRDLVIEPDDVRILQIGIGAFADCDRLESVTLPFTGASLDDGNNYWFGFIFGSDSPRYDPGFVPESLRNITITVQKVYNVPLAEDTDIMYSFYQLPCVETVVLPKDTYYIGPEMFARFSSLRKFDIPRLLKSIERDTFCACGNLREAYLPDGVVYIGSHAFNGCGNLETVHLNDGLLRIEDALFGTFGGCGMRELILPDSIEYIGTRAFINCINLKAVSIPAHTRTGDTEEMFANCTSIENVTINCDSVGNRMFDGCTSLKTLNLSGDIRYIGEYAFNGCEQLEAFDIPVHLELIGNNAFGGCRSLCIDLILPEGLTEIGDNAFSNTGVTSVVVPSTCTKLGASAFSDCYTLATAEIKSQIKTVPVYCFGGDDNLEHVYLPDSIETIGFFAFIYCSKLKVDILPASLKFIDGWSFFGCTDIVELVIPESLVKIEDNAFGNCNIISIVNYSDVDISGSLVTIDKTGVQKQEYVFISDDGLVYYHWGDGDYDLKAYIGDANEITIPSEIDGKHVNVYLDAITGLTKKVIISEGITTVAIGTYIDEICLPSTMKEFAISDNTQIGKITLNADNELLRLENGILIHDDDVIYCERSLNGAVTIPDGIKTIGEYAFYGSNITSVVFPDTLIEIKDYAFEKCSRLTNLVLPDSVVNIGMESFSDCSSLSSVDLGSCEYIGASAFNASKIVNLTVPGSVKTISECAFSNSERLKNIVIESGVEIIERQAFLNCDAAISLTLSEGLITIGEEAFNWCRNLKDVYLPASVESIGVYALPYVENLTVSDESDFYELYDGVLYSADGSTVVWTNRNITQITLLPTTTEISKRLFFDNQSIESVVIPFGVTKIGESAFNNCGALKSISIPDSVRVIEGHAFEGTGIEEINLPSALEELGDSAFPRSIKKLTISDGNENFSVIDGVLYHDGHLMMSSIDVPDTVVIPDGISVIDEYAFSESSIKKIIMPDSVKLIGLGAFGGSQLEEIVWSDSVETICTYAFSGTNIKELMLPESVIEIGAWYGGPSFIECKELRKVYIPASIREIKSDEFKGCTNLEIITVSPDNENFYTKGKFVYRHGTDSIFIAPYVYNGPLVIPEGTTEIPSGCFDHRIGITEIIIPETVEYIGGGAFAYIQNIITVRIPSSVQYIDGSAFDGLDGILFVENESNIDIYPGCDLFPDSLIVINKGNVLSAIVDEWRYYLTGDFICSEYIGEDETVNRYRVNAYLGDMEELTLPTILDGHNVIPYKFEPNKASTLIIAEGVEAIPEGAFVKSRTIKRLILPDSVRELAGGTFSYSSITEINIPQGILYIDMWLFEECNDLRSVTLPDMLIEIGFNAFYRCYSLKTIELPDSLRYIDNCAFEQSGIEYIEFPPYLETIGNCAFYYTKLHSVVIPDSVKSIGRRAFDTSSIENITLPDTDIFLGADILPYYWWTTEGYTANEENWDGDFLYIGSHLIRYRGNEVHVVVDRDVKSICENAFEGCYNTRYLEISGDGIGALKPKYLSNLEMLVIRSEPQSRISDYFRDYYDGEWGSTDVPDTLKGIVIGERCYVEHRDEFNGIEGVNIFVEGTKSDSPFDRIAPGWNNENVVTYGDKWYMATFFDAEGNVLSMECFRNSQVIRPPYVVLPSSGDTAYTHIGWDLDGDGEPDGMPASRLSDVEAHAVVRTSKPAHYTVKFIDIDSKTVIEKYTLEYGQPITPPANTPEKKGYTFLGWENYQDGDTVSEDIKIYSIWSHNGNGHEYVSTIVEPTCIDRGYTLHKCSICDDEYRTDYVDAKWHTFGEWITDKEPTCAECGEKHRTCSICGFVENAAIDTTGHEYVSHVIKEATCTDPGVVGYECSACGNQMQEAIPLQPHDFQRVFADKDYIEWLDNQFSGIVWGCNEEKTEFWYYTCSSCGKIQVAAEAKAAGVSSGHRHEFAAILNDEGRAVAVKCTLCGEIVCHEHDFEKKIAEDGSVVYECKNCHETMEEQVEFTPGDINGDGSVDNQDVVALFRYVSGGKIEVVKAALDPDGDGDATNLDVVLLFRYVSGANVELSTVPYTG